VLALLHRAYGPATEEDWGRWWREPALPQKQLRDYLVGKTSRFDLFDAPRVWCRSRCLSPSPGGLEGLIVA
jgi:CRISPR system Cascade subunit CasA